MVESLRMVCAERFLAKKTDVMSTIRKVYFMGCGFGDFLRGKVTSLSLEVIGLHSVRLSFLGNEFIR